MKQDRAFEIGDEVRIIIPVGIIEGGVDHGRPICGMIGKIRNIDGANHVVRIKGKSEKYEFHLYDNEIAMPEERWWGSRKSEKFHVLQHIENNMKLQGWTAWKLDKETGRGQLVK